MHISQWLNAHYYGVTPGQALGTILGLAVAGFVIIYLIRVLRRVLLSHHQRLHVSYEMVMLTTRLVHVALWIAVGFLLLSSWGVGVSGLWTALLSVVTLVGVGFLATWTMISNVTANLFLTLWRPFHLGATVEILPENLRGKVVDTNMMFTVMREEGGGTLHVPNNMFFQKIFRVSGRDDPHMFEFFEKQSEMMANIGARRG